MTATEYPIEYVEDERLDERLDESHPLLSNDRATTSRSRTSFILQTRSRKTMVLLILCIVFTLAFGGFLMAVPAMRLYEDIICHHYYESLEEKHSGFGFEGSIDESLCKGDEVQNRLNILLAGLHFLGAIPGMLGWWEKKVVGRYRSNDCGQVWLLRFLMGFWLIGKGPEVP